MATPPEELQKAVYGALRLDGDVSALVGDRIYDAGPEEIFNRLRLGMWRVDDVIEPLRLGLIGSKAMTASEAGPFVSRLINQVPIMEFKMAAISVLASALLIDEADPVGEAEGVAPARENGDLAESTETAP